MYFVFTIKIRQSPFPVTMEESHEKKCQNYFRETMPPLQNNMVKCRRIVNFEEIDVEHSAEKNDEFQLGGIFKEYTKQNIIMTVSREANTHSIDIFRLIKNH